MSTAVYPLGMKSYPASGYTQKSSAPDQYVSWKGTGLSKTPVGVTAGSVRPLTNKDYGNVFPAAFGKPRPIKHSRKGSLPSVMLSDSLSTEQTIEAERNMNRDVKSGTNGYLVSQMITNPGGFIVKQNTLSTDKPNCGGVCVSANYQPNVTYLTQNPNAETQSKILCCNEEKKARRRVLPANTNLPKKYNTSHLQYLENKCKTFQQNEFNFVKESYGNPNAKPGAPDADNYYVPNCYCPTTDCGRVYYKPNNYQFAQQGAVSSSALNLRLNKNTIDTNRSSLNENEIIYKNKSESCKPQYAGKTGNSKTCPMFAIYTPASYA